jgi:hypothetical protein
MTPTKEERKSIMKRKRKKASRKRKKIMRKGISLLWSLSFVSLCLDRTRSREGERESAHSLESAIERERENTLAQANERAREREQSRSVCRSGFACFGHEFWGVNKRQFGREREGGEERRCWGNLLGCHIGEAFASLFLSE